MSRRDAVVLALAVFALCVLVGQRTFYGPDGRAILKMTMSGMQVHPLHFFYVPMLRVSHALAARFGGSWYDAGLLLSQVGTAVGAFFWHRAAARLGATRTQAAAVVALCVTAPAILFFASVIELHAPFLAFAGLAAYAAARLARRPSPAAAAGLGIATGLAVGGHATAHLLPLWLLPLALVESAAPRSRRWLLFFTIAGLVHAAIAAALAPALRACGQDVHASGAADYVLRARSHQLSAGVLPAQVWMDWLAPFAPLSFVLLLGVSRQRALATVLLFGLLPSLAATFVLMAPTTENGAYLVPLVWPAALLVVRTLPRWLWAITAVVGFGLGWRWIAGHEDTAFGRAFAADVRAEAGGRPMVLICGQHPEFDACFIFAPDLRWRTLIDEASLPPEAVSLMVERMAEWVEAQARDGVGVLLTEGARQYLLAPVGPEQRTGPLLWQGIEGAFALEPVHRSTLRGWWLRRR